MGGGGPHMHALTDLPFSMMAVPASKEIGTWPEAKKCFAGLPPRTPLAAGGRRAAGPKTPELGPSGPKTSSYRLSAEKSRCTHRCPRPHKKDATSRKKGRCQRLLLLLLKTTTTSTPIQFWSENGSDMKQ